MKRIVASAVLLIFCSIPLISFGEPYVVDVREKNGVIEVIIDYQEFGPLASIEVKEKRISTLPSPSQPKKQDKKIEPPYAAVREQVPELEPPQKN